MRRGLLLLGALLGIGLPDAVAAQALQRMEVVGAVGAPEGARPPDLRNRATQEAVMRATLRIAYPLLDPDALAQEPIAPGELDAWLASLLGDDPLEYASRFRILEDRGVRSSLLSAEHEQEYVVLVEAYVDVERVRERLEGRGVLVVESPEVPGHRVEILAEIGSYDAYQGLLNALKDISSVADAHPVAFERGEAALAVETHSGPDSLLLALLRERSPRLSVEALGVGSERLRLRVEWIDEVEAALPDPAEGVPGDGSGVPDPGAAGAAGGEIGTD